MSNFVITQVTYKLFWILQKYFNIIYLGLETYDME